jgi:serine phosphatase RsbU (regulator of sigma subunit)
MSESGQVERTLESSGPPLGLFPEICLARSASMPLHPGQLLVLLTDGITESTASDGEEWGAEGVLEYLRSSRDLAAHELVDGLYNEARRFACNELQQDDITSVVVKVTE